MKGLSKIKKGVAGVYKISINEHIYIGQSIDILNRLRFHQCELQRREHPNRFLQNAYIKNKSKVKVQVLYKAKPELFAKEQLKQLLTIVEQTFINYYKADLNLQPAYPSNLGNKFKSSICNFNGTLYHPNKGTVRIKNLGKYCKDNNLDSAEMKKVTLGKIDHYKGYFYSEKVYQVYKDRAIDYGPLEGIDLPLPLLTKDTRLINQLMEEILDKKDLYSEEAPPWSNKQLAEDLFINYIEKEYPGVLPNLLEGNRRISEYPVCGFSCQKDPSSLNVFKNTLDIRLDVSSYRDLYYPLGNPTIIKEDRVITLKEFLNTYKNELVDKLYVIYVEGLLEHEQDLVFSKYSSLENKDIIRLLKDNYENDDSCDGKIEGDFLLTSRQLRWGVITSEVLNVIRKVSSHKQWAEWMNLKVTLAIYYPKSSELPLEEWSRNKESNHWCRIPIEPLITKLKEVQQSSDPCKHIINTLYATLASTHSFTGNTVLANNITASVRTGSWIMSKALGCKFIVTDGGIYEFDSIPQFKTHLSSFRKPGLQSLFLKDERWNKFVGTQPLSKDIDNLESFLLEDKSKAAEYLDKKALEIIQSFCSIYDLDFSFKIEHKIENSASIAVTNPFGKVDYLLYTYWDEEVIRIRGVKTSERDKHPKVEALRALKDNRPLKFHGAILYQLIGVNEYIKNPNRFNKDLPGYEVSLEYIYKPNRTGGNVFKTWEEHHRAKDAHRKRVAAYDKKYKNVELILKPSFL